MQAIHVLIVLFPIASSPEALLAKGEFEGLGVELGIPDMSTNAG